MTRSDDCPEGHPMGYFGPRLLSPGRRGRHRHAPDRRLASRGSNAHMQLVLAAALSVVAALAEFTIVPYLKIGDAVLHPTLVFGVIWVIAGGLEAGLTWAFVGGLALDVLGQRPLGSSAFSLLVAIGMRVRRRRLPRPGPHHRPRHRHGHRQSRLLDASPDLDHRALRGAALDRSPRGRAAVGAVYDTVLAAVVGPLAMAVVAPPPGRGAGGLVNATLLNPHRERDRRPIRFLAFGLITRPRRSAS